LTVGLVKTGTFQSYGKLPLSFGALAALIGISGVPGAFVAKWISDRLSVKVHKGIMDGMVMIGGAVLIARGLNWL
jgi:uncharacterized membrane protein YfcA